MIIDARKFKGDKSFRPMTAIGAVSAFIDGMNVGDSHRVEKFIDPLGDPLGDLRLSALISKLRGKRVFKVITRGVTDAVAVVHRIA